MSLQKTEGFLNFNVQVKVGNGTNEHCPGYYVYEKAFCPLNSTKYNWEFCSSLDIKIDPTDVQFREFRPYMAVFYRLQ